MLMERDIKRNVIFIKFDCNSYLFGSFLPFWLLFNINSLYYEMLQVMNKIPFPILELFGFSENDYFVHGGFIR